MISRKIAGRAIRYIVIIPYIGPVLFVAFGQWASDKLHKLFTKWGEKLMRVAEKTNAAITKWESNSPEGTMERLRAKVEE